MPYAFEKASRSFIENGNYPKSNTDFIEKNKDVFNCVQKIVEGSIENETDKPAKINTAVSLVGDRTKNLLVDNKLEVAEKLIKSLRRVNNERADYYSKLLRVYQQNYNQEEKRFHFVETTSNAESKNPWTDLFRKWSMNIDN